MTPDVPDMPWRLEDGVKVFEIAVEHVRTEFVPGRIVDAWGFNGSVPGPTIQVNEGDRVRLIVENRRMTTIDEAAVTALARRQACRLWEKL